MEIVDDAPDGSLDLFMFVDANYAISTSHRDSPSVPHRAFAANGADGTTSNGFSLEWMGLDASYDGGEVGATASLRFGDGVPTYFGNRSESGIANLTQAYATWAPHERITLDLGQFTTIYGAEVAESFRNLNYTRGGLYYLMQPAWHTGLKGGFAISDGFGINALVVNGVNSTFDEDDAPSLGLQLSIVPVAGDEEAGTAAPVEFYLGGLQTLDSDNDNSSNLDTFVDLVAVLNVGDFKGIVNADFNIARDSIDPDQQAGTGDEGDAAFFGASVGLGYSFSHLFGLAARYEFLRDPDDILYGANPDDGTTVQTFTGTIDLKPLPERDNFVVRWDNRYERASEDIFLNTTNEATSGWFESVIGVVVKTNE